MRPLQILLLLLLVAGSAKAQTNDARIVALEKELDQLLTDWKAAGFAVAVESSSFGVPAI